LGPPGWGSGFGGRDFDTGDCFLFRLPNSQLRGCCGYELRLLRPGRLPGGSHFRVLGSFRDRLGGGFGVGVGGVVALTTSPLERRDSTRHPRPSAR